MTHGLKKSDSAIVATKPANNGVRASAEPVERRAGPKENSKRQNRHHAQEWARLSHAADRVRQAAKRKPRERLVALLHHVNEQTLHRAFLDLRKDAAVGVDGVTWQMYAEGLEGRLADLKDRVHSGAYRAPPSRRVYIPKESGGKRPLGIASLEDKIVQRAVTDNILVPIYETEFLGFSYGFRPGRGAHDALDAVTVGIKRRKVNWILDCDIRGFFDNVDRDWLVRFLEHRIGDKRVLRLVVKWLNAGIMEGVEWSDTGVGTPQGAIVSPVLANVFLHYSLDLWFHKLWRKREARGDAIIVRYADDFIIGCQHESDVKRLQADLAARLAKFGLSLNEDKTKVVKFGRFARLDWQRRGQAKPGTFDFLGMTHYCAQTRKGWFQVGRKPSRKRVNRTLKRLRAALMKRRHLGIRELARWTGSVIRGWLNYYAVPGSMRSLSKFRHTVVRLFQRALRRRSQKDRTTWSVVHRLADACWPKLRILHPWPEQRIAVKIQRRSRMP